MRSAWAFASARAAVVAALVAAGPPEPSAARSDRPTPVTTIVWSGARPAEPGYSGYGYETAEPLAALPLAPAPTVVGPLEVPPPSSTAGAPSEVEPLGRRESCVEKTTGPRASTTPPPATAPRRSPTSRASPMERRALDMSAGLRAALAAAGRGGRDMTRDARNVVQVQRPRGRRRTGPKRPDSRPQGRLAPDRKSIRMDLPGLLSPADRSCERPLRGALAWRGHLLGDFIEREKLGLPVIGEDK